MAVNLTTQTSSGGFYQFSNLRPGQYTITQVTQPKGYSAGLITIGSLGGSKSNRVFSGINTSVGQTGNDYNFAQLGIKPPDGITTYPTKGQLLGYVPPPPVTPPNGQTVGTPSKGQLLGYVPPATITVTLPSTTTVRPPNGQTVTTTLPSKGQLLGYVPPRPPIGIVVGTPSKGQLLRG